MSYAGDRVALAPLFPWAAAPTCEKISKGWTRKVRSCACWKSGHHVELFHVPYAPWQRSDASHVRNVVWRHATSCDVTSCRAASRNVTRRNVMSYAMPFYIYIYMYLYIYIYINMYVCMYVCIYVCMYVYIYIYIHLMPFIVFSVT